MNRNKPLIVLIIAICLLSGAAAGLLVQYALRTEKKDKTSKQQVTQTYKRTTIQPKDAGVTYKQPTPCDPQRMQGLMDYLCNKIGPRVEGQPEERAAADYLASELERIGYEVERQPFSLPDGRPSENLIAYDPGESDQYVFITSGHIDSRPSSPGANDNASGCAATLELAKTIKGTKYFPEIKFILFGAEEDYGPNRTIGRAHV